MKRLNAIFKSLISFNHRQAFWVTGDEKVMRKVVTLPPNQQKQAIEASGNEPHSSSNQIDFVKERVAVEVQFGKYAFVAHDIFVKHQSFYAARLIDVGIEILPVKAMEKECLQVSRTTNGTFLMS